ncbi:MAG: helix-turn-helix domain-containing protein [Chryseotalea sp.]|jgi:transcriptional regulator with XRE-family HTH domain
MQDLGEILYKNSMHGRAIRLKMAREYLNLSQTEAAIKAKVFQKDISTLENRKREVIPPNYLEFLYNNGINLNWLILGKEDMLTVKDKSNVKDQNLLLSAENESVYKEERERQRKAFNVDAKEFESIVQEQHFQIMKERLDELNKMFDEFKKKTAKKIA